MRQTIRPFKFGGMKLVTSTAMVALSLLPVTMQAQSDSTIFRPGQWGAEFVIGGANGLGVMRFSSPTRAWIGMVSGEVQSVDGETSQAGLQDVTAVDLRIGNRWFRPVTPNLLQHFTLGVLGGTRRTEQESALIEGPLVNRSSGFGVFADLGAQWMVTPNLSLGASYGLTTSVARQTNALPDGERRRTITTVTLGPVGIRAALYF